MEVAFQRVRSGSRNGVSQRQGCQESHDGPLSSVQRSTNAYGGPGEAAQGCEMEDREEHRKRDPRHSRDRSDDIVDERQLRLRVDEIGIAGKERGIGALQDRRTVERLIGRTVAVTGRVERGKDNKREKREGKKDKKSLVPFAFSLFPFIVNPP